MITLSETLTKLRGRHQIKVGAEYGFDAFVQALAYEGANVGAFTFTRNYTSNNPGATGTLTAAAQGNAFASFLIGYPRSQTITLAAVPELHYRAAYYGAFVQDDWRLSSRFTLNVGLRYDYEQPVSERDNLVVSGFDFTTKNPIACALCAAAAARPDIVANRADGGAGLANPVGGVIFADGPVYKGDFNNVGPRLGATYQLTHKMVLRGGYGKTFLAGLSDRGTQAGNTRSTAYNPSNNNNLTPASNLSQTIGLLYPNGLLQPLKNSQGLLTNVGTSVSFHNQNRQNQEFQQYSAEVQYQLPWRSVGSIGYVGSRTNKRPITIQLNDLTPAQLALGDAFLNELVPNPFAGLLPGSSFFNNAFSGNGATIQRRQLLRPYPQFDNVSEGLIPEGKLWYHALQAQWEKRLSRGVSMLVSYTFSRSWEEVDPLNAGEGRYKQLSANDRPHALRINGNWTMPNFENRGRWLRGLAGGWQTGIVANIRSGAAINMPFGVDVIGPIKLDNATLGRWFNTCTIGLDGSRNACGDPIDARVADPGRQPLQPAFALRPTNALDTTGSRIDAVRVSSPPIIDMTFSRSFRLSPGVRSQLRVDLYNLTGAVQWPAPSIPNTSAITNFSTFGTVASTQSNDPRFVMLTFRIQY